MVQATHLFVEWALRGRDASEVRASLDRHSRLVDMGRRMSTVAEDNDALESLEKDVDQETFSLARSLGEAPSKG